jgi:hypothetical protein
MDYKDRPTGADGNPYIWLRYTTQFTTGGRTHSIEMGIPVPVGASAEMREQLIREAESGMEQLTRHVENRVMQMLQRNARPHEPATGGQKGSIPASQPPTGGQKGPVPASQLPTPLQMSSETPQAPQAPQPAVPPTRQTVGANMPSTPGIPGDANGNMKLGQFMQFIRETWGLTPKQAMDLLNVKSLNGLNYREVLRQLQPLVEQQANNAPASNQKLPVPGQSRPVEKPSNPGVPASAASSSPSPSSPAHTPVGARELKRAPQAPPMAHTITPNQEAAIPNQDVRSTMPASPASSSPSPAHSTASAASVPGASKPASTPKPPAGERGDNAQATASPVPVPQSPAAPAKAPIVPIRMVRDETRKYKFDEEEDELPLEEDDNDQKMAMARIKLDELKEVRGTSAANPARLAVLHNVVNSQIADEQIQRLIQAAWGATSVKKLKVDQAEALISWAKEDYFVEEVDAVLTLIDEEESYARSDW